MNTKAHCNGSGCDRPCRGVSDCRLHKISRVTRMHQMPKIRKLLKSGPVSRATICTALGFSTEQAEDYLRHLHRDLREIRPSKAVDGADLWELGEDPLLPSADGDQRTVPARQVGMKPDPLALPVAFFGLACQEMAA